MKNSKVGVAVGRFQIHELHEGHVALLDYIAERHELMIILVGYNTIRFNTSDPFPFEIRKQMLETRYPKAVILPIQDSPISSKHWSVTVDETISGVCSSQKAVLYGSRDSFIPKYSGVYYTKYVRELPNRSATQIREEISGEYINDPMFRRGWLAAILTQFAITDPTVDMAIHTADFSKVLLGKRDKESEHYRFFGGFVDPNDKSCEDAAKRERIEEAMGVKVSNPEYIGTQRIKDPRYKKSKYGIMTTFFAMKHMSGEPRAGDDIGWLGWRNLDESLFSVIAPEHVVLVRMLLQYKRERLAQ